MYKEEIVLILKEIKGCYFDIDKELISGGYLDSFDILEIIEAIDNKYNINIRVDEISLYDFDSVNEIEKIIIKYKTKE